MAYSEPRCQRIAASLRTVAIGPGVLGSHACSAFSVVDPGEPGVDLSRMLSPGTIEILPAMNALCLLGHNQQRHDIGEPYIDRLQQNTPRDVKFGAPLLVAQGTADKLVKPGLSEPLAADHHAVGTTVTNGSM